VNLDASRQSSQLDDPFAAAAPAPHGAHAEALCAAKVPARQVSQRD